MSVATTRFSDTIEVTYQLERFPENGTLAFESQTLSEILQRLERIREASYRCIRASVQGKRKSRKLYLLVTIKFRCVRSAQELLSQVIIDYFAPAWYISDTLSADEPCLLLRSWKVQVVWPKTITLDNSDQTLILKTLRDRLQYYGTPDTRHAIRERSENGTTVQGFWFYPLKSYGAQERLDIATIVEARTQVTCPEPSQGKMTVHDRHGDIVLNLTLKASPTSKRRSHKNCQIL